MLISKSGVSVSCMYLFYNVMFYSVLFRQIERLKTFTYFYFKFIIVIFVRCYHYYQFGFLNRGKDQHQF